MGFDVIGSQPKSECGEYFRNSIWWWHPLWHYISSVCCDMLTEAEIKAGEFNDGLLISAEKSRAIGFRLKFLIDQKEVKKFETEYQEALDRLPDETCEACKGKGSRYDQYVQSECGVCKRSGKVRPWSTHYPFSEENVREIDVFELHSGG
jgi:hypothetical protein